MPKPKALVSEKDVPPRKRRQFFSSGDENARLGRGIDYAQINYSDFKVTTPVVEPGQSMCATVKLSNVGKLAGVEVVHLFVRSAGSGAEQRRCKPRQLSQVKVNPGKSVIVDLSIPYECFQAVGLESNLTMGNREKFDVAVGGVAQDAAIQMATVLVVQKTTPAMKGRKKPETKLIKEPKTSSSAYLETISP